jgi:hypothetical protein
MDVAEALNLHGYAAVLREKEATLVAPTIEAYLVGGLKVIEVRHPPLPPPEVPPPPATRRYPLPPTATVTAAPSLVHLPHMCTQQSSLFAPPPLHQR